MTRRNVFFLTLIIILGAILRLVYLTSNPPSLNWDEVSHGYNAYSLLKTGADEWGQRFPIINFRAFGDYPTTLNLYLTIPFVAVLGLTEVAIRLPHAILGILTIISVYFLALGIFKRKDMALLSAFLVATSPWYIFTSRFVLQSNLSVFLLATSMALFFNRERHKYFLNISFALLFLTLFSYHTTRIFSPLFLVALIINYKDVVLRKWKFLTIFFLTTFLILLNPISRSRSQVLSILDSGAIASIENSRNVSKLAPVIKKLIYNRPVYFTNRFFKNYFGYFTPQFLFLGGGTQYQFSVPKTGLIYLVCLPFFYLGLFIIIKKAIKEKDFRLLMLWTLLFPIPASLTNETFAVLRATTFLPIPEILISIGFYAVVDSLKKYEKLLKTLFFISILLSLCVYLNNYFGSYRRDYSWSWQYGYKEAVGYIKTNYSKYDKIVITKKYGEPHEFILFYMAWNPSEYRQDPQLNRFYQSGWYWVDGFDKFYFVNDWQIDDYPDKFVLESKKDVSCKKNVEHCLLITSPGNVQSSWRKIKTIDFVDGKPAFELYEN